MNELTLKQIRFIDHYLDIGNATEAAARVYGCKKRNTARSIGAENLAKPAILEAIRIKTERVIGNSDAFVLQRLYTLASDAKSQMVQLHALDRLARILGLFEETKVSPFSPIHINLPDQHPKTPKFCQE